MSNIAVITGASSGIGEITAKTLNEKGFQLYILVRNVSKAKQVTMGFKYPSKVDIIECDLFELESVKKAAQELLSKTDRIDLLINNAGGIFQEFELNSDGLERHFVVNHLSHFLLTKLLLNVLKQSRTKIINLSSEAHRQAKMDLETVNSPEGFTSFKAYANSKLCNIYFTKEIHSRFKELGITAFSVHPGVVKTGFGKDLKGFFKVLLNIFSVFMISPEKGAKTTLYVALTGGLDSGKYYKNSDIDKPKLPDDYEKEAQKLWTLSENLVKKYL